MMATKKIIIEELYYRVYVTFMEQMEYERESVEEEVGPISDEQWYKYTKDFLQKILKKSGYEVE